MSTKSKGKTRPARKSKAAARIIWFEIPADRIERAKKFYSALFGWKIQAFPALPDYWHVDTGGGDDTPDGGLVARRHPQQAITNYVNVASVTRSMARVKQLGGKVCQPRTAVPQMGYLAVCQDTENNTFALWESNPKAK